ncbi:MAG: tyrosine-type recombinase/integrase [Candidatus Bathyarchaeia archaeon]
MLNKDEVLRIFRVAEHPMHKAMVTTQNELAGRPLELLTMRIKDVEFNQYSAVVRVWGKKKPCRVRLVLATPALRQWLEIHPRREDLNAPLWICPEGKHAGEPLSYDRARKLIQILAEMAGIKKRVNPYKFRHSTITAFAGRLTEAEICEVFGWKQGSRIRQ